MLSRRTFLGSSSAALASRLFGQPGGSNKPSPELEKLGAAALAAAKRLKASYADIRICRYRDQSAGLRMSPERGTGKTLEVPVVNDRGSFGFGVRVIVDGAWGFAASPNVNAQEIPRVTSQAVAVAKANAAYKTKPVVLAPVKAYTDRWSSPFEKSPFDVSPTEKLEVLRAAASEVKKSAKVHTSTANMNFHAEDKYFASSEGSSIQQYVLQTFASMSANAVDFQKGVSKNRNYTPPPQCIGWEYVRQMNFVENAQRIREEVAEHVAAPPVTPGKKDLVLMPGHLSLTIHESIGHPTELDRALGYEANFAGTSFLTIEKMGKERVGSDLVTIYGDRTMERALSTVAYDHDGVKPVRFPIIEKGVFKHYQTIRDQAHLVGEKESRGCCYAQSWADIPFQRMPNVWLAPGADDMTLEQLIAGVDDGILIDGRGSYSIDQQRYNFQFGGDAFWEIKGGKKGRMISRVAYQSRTTDFWQACDGIAGRPYWVNYGFPSDGKGEPIQLNSMSHGCSPARFRQINVIVTD